MDALFGLGASEWRELESNEIDTCWFGMVMEDLDEGLDDLDAPDGLELESNGDWYTRLLFIQEAKCQCLSLWSRIFLEKDFFTESKLFPPSGCWFERQVRSWLMCYFGWFEASLFRFDFKVDWGLWFPKLSRKLLEVGQRSLKNRFDSGLVDLLLTHLGGVCSWFSIDCFFLPS